uniref:intraflagellar transport-associated protein n=1 Tax=Jaculus jaculus TaxID=51337 RepID=UPI001E1B32D4|nr:intraflagellar transport-associated protein [Jaculus jaculus]XP_045012635.1 intraflagellar transport-associated protein [Jaculus jaculus]XP_045012636.1 intraflagellar transport-associated protein [Jaculus jaculus]XP_045012637.1 intraflagellar transport-associated protein [Jaculus jaculus]
MPSHILELDKMDEDRLSKEVLDKFVNCHEQTYEEFLNTFIHLSKEDKVIKGGARGTSSSENTSTSVKFPQKSGSNGHYFRNTAIVPHTSSQYSEVEQILINEGQKVGGSFQGDLVRAGEVKVDNFLDLEDLDLDEENEPQMSKDVLLLLPGEVEPDVSPSAPPRVSSADQPVASEGKPKPTMQRTHSQREEILGDEVQPFSLDEEFDYDNLTLTPKFTAEEIEALKELSKQERKDSDTDLGEPQD